MEQPSAESILTRLAEFTGRDRRRLVTISNQLYASAYALTHAATARQHGPSRVDAAAAVRDAYAYLVSVGGTDDDIRRSCAAEIDRQQTNPIDLGNRTISDRGKLVKSLTTGVREPTDADFANDTSSGISPGLFGETHYEASTDDGADDYGTDCIEPHAERGWAKRSSPDLQRSDRPQRSWWRI